MSCVFFHMTKPFSLFYSFIFPQEMHKLEFGSIFFLLNRAACDVEFQVIAVYGESVKSFKYDMTASA